MGKQPGERRSYDRLALTAECELETDESQLRVQLADISPTGCRFEADGTVQAGTAILLALHDEFPPVDAEVVWASGGSHGAQFAEPLEPELIQALVAMSRLYGNRLATNVHRVVCGGLLSTLASSGGKTSLKDLKRRGAAMRSRATMGDGNKVVDTKTFNVGKKTRKIMAEADDADKYRLMFNCPELNLAIVSKAVVRNGQDYGLRPSQLATKLALPYDLTEKGTVSTSGARAIYVGEPRFARAMQDVFFGDTPKDKVARDMRIINIFNAIPSLDPFLLRDQFDMEEIDVNPAYLDIDQQEWESLCSSIMADFRHIVQVLFKEDTNLEQRTQTLVTKLWSAIDLESLRPLTQALQLDEDEAKTAFFGWKGIIFYTHKYEKSLQFFSEAVNFVQYEIKPQFPRLLRDGTPIDWQRIFHSLQQAQDDVASVVAQYRHLIQNFGTADFAGEFRDFLNMASDLFWLLGSNLAIMDHISAAHQDLSRRSRTQQESEDFVRMLIDISLFYS